MLFLEFFKNIKEGFFKKIFYIFFTGGVGVFSYISAYQSGIKESEYECLINARNASDKIQKEMNLFKHRLDYEYKEKVNNIMSDCDDNNTNCKLFI